ncbi:MAG: PD-(D/E)XK nuclease family protein, partial [Burkholderiales bacterium]
AEEIESEVDKRDFGNWLHRTLKLFHDGLKIEQKATSERVGATNVALIDIAAEQARRELGLGEAEFLPFASAWPRVRDGYLAWLSSHEAAGNQFDAGEAARELGYGTLTLHGRIDRIDRAAGGTALLIDYKTEAEGKTRERIKNPDEDTQLAFYGALLEDDTFAAIYLNIGEKETKTFEQQDVVDLRDALVDGMRSDVARIAAGAALPPMGEGAACDFCAARGLCRKDFWS